MENLRQLTYNFTDSSTAPRYHRSYSLNFTKDSIVLTVESYFEILAQKTYSMPENGIKKIEQALVEHKIAIQDKIENKDGCVGGTSKSISFVCEGGAAKFYATAYYCGGKQFGTLSGNVGGFLEVLNSFTPDLSEFVRSTRL